MYRARSQTLLNAWLIFALCQFTCVCDIIYSACHILSTVNMIEIQSVISYLNYRINGLWFCFMDKQGPLVLWAITIACNRLFNPQVIIFLELHLANWRALLRAGMEEGNCKFWKYRETDLTFANTLSHPVSQFSSLNFSFKSFMGPLHGLDLNYFC